MNKKVTNIIYLLAAIMFLLNSILWWSDGNMIVGILLAGAALFFGILGLIRFKKTRQDNKK